MQGLLQYHDPRLVLPTRELCLFILKHLHAVPPCVSYFFVSSPMDEESTERVRRWGPASRWKTRPDLRQDSICTNSRLYEVADGIQCGHHHGPPAA